MRGKYLKARLIEAAIHILKTRDLGAVLTLAALVEPAWEHLRADVDSLTDRAVEVRYPGYFADEKDAREAFRIAGEVRRVVRESLGLDTA